MVSLIRKFSCVFFMSALVLVCLLIPTELKAAPCCINGKLSTCADLGGGLSYDLSGCENLGNPGYEKDNRVDLEPSEGEEVLKGCTFGQVQYKPSGDCGTSTRTCCLDGTWSEWDGECSGSSSCSSGQCWNGTICEDKGTLQSTCQSLIPNTVSGNLTRTAECVSGSGWKYGEWDGVCECAEGYKPDEGSDLTCHETSWRWKALDRDLTYPNPYNKMSCEDATYSDTYLWKQFYGNNDASYILDSDCKKWMDSYGSYVYFQIWDNEECNRYYLQCEAY